jgi:hypothetical protein
VSNFPRNKKAIFNRIIIRVVNKIIIGIFLTIIMLIKKLILINLRTKRCFPLIKLTINIIVTNSSLFSKKNSFSSFNRKNN